MNTIITPSDWQFNKLLVFSLVLSAGAVIFAAFLYIGISVPVLTQVCGFIFITFIPGILLLRILRIHNTGWIECLAYSVGLSLALDMAVMVAINFMLPAAGIPQPLTVVPISIAFAVVTSILILAAHIRDRAFTPPPSETQAIYWPPFLLLTLLLAATILAAKMADTLSNNTLLVICLIAIAAIVLIAALGRFIRPAQYPFAIFIIGLCLLYQTTLMTPYLIGSDIYTEYAYYNLVSISGIWDPGTTGIVNSCLSITLLAPLYSIFMNIAGVWIFKAIYPLIFALMPVIMFQIFRIQAGPRVSFLAVFFFLAVPTFSLEMISLCRQQVAELFLVLLVLLLVDRRMAILSKLIMACIFAAGIIVSHYGIGTIGFIYMALFLPLVLVIRSNWFRRFWGWLSRNAISLPSALLSLPVWSLAIVVTFFFVFGLFWYSFTAAGINYIRLTEFWTLQSSDISSTFRQILQTGEGITHFLDFSGRDVLVRTALGLDFADASLPGRIFRIIQLLTQLLLIIGILRLIFKPGGLKFVPEYLALCIINGMLLAGCILLPGFAERFNTTRMYHLALITLAPFVILGCKALWEACVYFRSTIIRANSHTANTPPVENGPALIALIVLLPYFIFCSGLVFELSGQSITDRVDTPYSIALSKYRLDLTSSFSARDGTAATWLSHHSDADDTVLMDQHTGRFLDLMDVRGKQDSLTTDAVYPLSSGYIFLTAWNTTKGEVPIAIHPGLRKYVDLKEIPALNEFRDKLNIIYCDGGAQVLLMESK